MNVVVVVDVVDDDDDWVLKIKENYLNEERKVSELFCLSKLLQNNHYIANKNISFDAQLFLVKFCLSSTRIIRFNISHVLLLYMFTFYRFITNNCRLNADA